MRNDSATTADPAPARSARWIPIACALGGLVLGATAAAALWYFAVLPRTGYAALGACVGAGSVLGLLAGRIASRSRRHGNGPVAAGQPSAHSEAAVASLHAAQVHARPMRDDALHAALEETLHATAPPQSMTITGAAIPRSHQPPTVNPPNHTPPNHIPPNDMTQNPVPPNVQAAEPVAATQPVVAAPAAEPENGFPTPPATLAEHQSETDRLQAQLDAALAAATEALELS